LYSNESFPYNFLKRRFYSTMFYVIRLELSVPFPVETENIVYILSGFSSIIVEKLVATFNSESFTMRLTRWAEEMLTFKM